PGIADVWHPSTRTTQNAMLLTVHLKRGDLELEFFSTIATLGTPYDITLQELRIECLFPANDNTEHSWKQLLKAQNH
ncbi:MAG: XRE family transcriptional regulator, partial [Oscillatoriophycideae cyanobacterium NC_groundwater_1537_Pr4_S-0.65um_50_18]|nr:XRE family transcriptional regulator [Oscillatoriophycideae cyanobacterium NC_groundwater_1537_Pr4_S-0.65um_50_18]